MYGSDKVLLNIAARLQSGNEFRPIVVLPNDGPLRVALDAVGVETHLIPVAKISRASLTPKGLIRLVRELGSSLWRLRSLVRRNDVALVHSNTIAVLAGAALSVVCRLPHVWHVHELVTSPNLMRRGFPRLVSMLSSRVICISRMNARWLLDECPSLEGRLTIVWNGLPERGEIDALAAQRFREEIDAGESDVVVAFVGRFNRWKGQLVLMAALELLWARGVRNVRGVFVGGPPPGEPHHLNDLRAAVAQSSAPERYRVLDFVSDVWPVWDAADIAVVPSTEPEPFGLVAIEAMASGKPVVAAAHGGLIDIVDDDSTGVLVSPGDVSALADALDRLAADRELRLEMGARGRRRQIELFSLSSQVEAVSACYRSLVRVS